MNRSALFYAAIVLAVITIAMAIYYLIPGVYHPHLSLHHGFALVKSTRPIYVAGFFVLALIFGVLAFMQRPKKAIAH
jgi:hypothetical protein